MIREVLMSTWMVPLSNKMHAGAQFSSVEGEWRRRRKTKTITARNEMAKPATYSSSISTDIMILVHESPLAPLDQYLEDKSRLFQAMFPEKGKSRRLNENDWRIQMLPIEVPMMTAWPVLDMRVIHRSGGVDYPSGVPLHITKVVELDVIKWDMQGLDKILKPSEFTLGVKGTFYPDRRGPTTRFKGQLNMCISFALPTFVALIPYDLRQSLADSILEALMMNMKQRMNRSLLADYNKFKREKLKPVV